MSYVGFCEWRDAFYMASRMVVTLFTTEIFKWLPTLYIIYLKQAKKDVLLTKEALLLALNDAKKNNNTGDIYLINSKLQELGIKFEQEQNDENKDVFSDEMYKKLVQSLFTVPEQKNKLRIIKFIVSMGVQKVILGI